MQKKNIDEKMHKYHNILAHEQIQICMHQIISQLTKGY